jgi:vitamin B12 transporter
VRLDDFWLVTLAAHHDVTRYLQVFGRVENLLDEEYEEILGFSTPGITGIIGLRVGLDL